MNLPVIEFPSEIVEKNLDRVQDALREHPGNPARAIAEQCLEIAVLLLDKNAAYGNSALNPVRIFARGIDAISQIDVRLDDKLSRIARGHEYGEENTHEDLLGYLVLRRIAVAIAAAGGTR